MTSPSRENKSSCLVVEFIYTDGSLAAPTFNGDSRFTDLESPITGFSPGEPDAAPDPRITFKMPTMVPGMQEDRGVLTISAEHDLMRLMRREYTLPPITCRIYKYVFSSEAGPSSIGAQVMFLAEGVCASAKTPRSKPGLLEITLSNLKYDARQPSGVVATPQCVWSFGDPKTCGVNVAALTETASLQVISANGFQVQVSGLTVPRPNYWIAGYFYHEGVSLRIRDWDGANQFLLSQRVSYAMSQAALPLDIEARPGCRLTPGDCREYNNGTTEPFCGVGINIPAHNPLFEKGQG